MKSIQDIDQKIEALRLRKQETLKKISASFFKKSNKILGESFSPELALTILERSWKNADPKQKEAWLKESQKFLLSKPSKRKKQASQN
jgi:hypothetical protein